MKCKIIFLTFVIFSGLLFFKGQEKSAQNPELVKGLPLYNFFYLSKYLGASYLHPDQKKAVDAQFFNLIGPEKIKSIANSDREDFKKLKNYINLVLLNSPGNLEFVGYLKNEKWNEFRNKFKRDKTEEEYLQQIINITSSIKTFEKEKSATNIEKDAKEKILNQQIEELQLSENQTLEDPQIKIKKDSLISTTKQNQKLFDGKIKKYDEKIAVQLESLNQKIEVFSATYFPKHPESSNFTNDVEVVNKYYASTYVGKDLQVTNNYVQSVQSAGKSSFQVPSQAQLIDAMAVFLANRAKQEAAIWFMDQLRSRVKNPLVNEAFPETINLLNKLENYKVPNFSLEWRYAISSDFIKMPETIAGSEWMKVMVKDSTDRKPLQDLIKIGSKVNRLMAQNYTYRDIIQTLYLDEISNSENAAQQNTLRNTTTMLYAMTNELYSIDNLSNTPSFRLLTFEELNSLNIEQWNFLIDLVHLKYFYNADKTEPNEVINLFTTLKKQKQNANIFVSKILLNLSQFDKIRNEQEKLNENEKGNFSTQNYNTAWKIIDQITDNLKESSKFINVPDQEKYLLYIKNLKKSFKIYENIQKRNFSAAIQETLELAITSLPSTSTSQTPTPPDHVKQSDFICSINKDDQILIVQKVGESIKFFLDSKTKGTTPNIAKESFVQIKNFDEFNKLWNLSKNNNSNLDFLKDISNINTKEFKRISDKLKINSADLIKMINETYQGKTVSISNNNDAKKADHDFVRTLDEKYSKQLLNLASFFGDVLTATTSEQLTDVIGSHALPPTSYKLKRKMKSSFDLNAYVGAYGGYRLPSAQSTFNKDWTGGIIAPIGVTFSKSFGSKDNLTFGASLNFIDLGNIVNHYLTSSEKYYKDVHFSEVFSPSVNILYSIPRTPLVAFIGTTFLPLKSIVVGTETKNTSAFDVTIIQAGLAIDIPLINLWTNEKD